MDKEYLTVEDLVNHAKLLEAKSLFELYGDKSKGEIGNNKGGFGNKVEFLHYGIENNNESRPDVIGINVEIKTNPLRALQKGGFSPKESVALSMIEFTDIANEEFEDSAFLKKNRRILYNMFHYTGGEDYNNKFLLIDIITPSEADMKIIKKDWELIKSKAKNLTAHTLSQSDTDYLIAMTKGQGNQKEQPYANGKAKAKRRAYAFKAAYIRHILKDYTLVEEATGKKYYQKKSKEKLYSLLSSSDEGNIESTVLKKFAPYMGLSDIAIATKFNCKSAFVLDEKSEKGLNKARWHNNTSLILTGEKKKFLSKHIEEFSKSGLTVKTVRLNKKGNLCEEISFRTQDFEGLLVNDWEESSLYDEMSSKFLWVVYKENPERTGEFLLYKVFFWTMPEADLNYLSGKWAQFKSFFDLQDYRHQYFQEEDSFYFLKIKDQKGGANREFNNTSVTTLSHWFRKQYVLDIINRASS